MLSRVCRLLHTSQQKWSSCMVLTVECCCLMMVLLFLLQIC